MLLLLLLLLISLSLILLLLLLLLLFIIYYYYHYRYYIIIIIIPPGHYFDGFRHDIFFLFAHLLLVPLHHVVIATRITRGILTRGIKYTVTNFHAELS